MDNRHGGRAACSGTGPARTGLSLTGPSLTGLSLTERSLAELPLTGLSLDARVRLLTGADNWRTPGDASVGLRPMAFSDGPAGVRGIAMDERAPSASLPCPSALGATWDPGLVGEVAAALGAEARGKDIDVLLAPTIHLMRTPLGGRGFECFSEDPVLTARIAAAYVRGVQDAGVACAVKHFICNDSETQRWTSDIRVAEHVLRELYLVPFEACVREAGVLAVMAGYNSVNGTTMTENARLLRDVLKGEWGFTGVVLSDWHAARSTEETAEAGLDLAMPGPAGPWGERLTAAVRSGRIAESDVDDKVRRVLGLADRVGALNGAGSRHGTLDGAPDGAGSPDGAPDGAGSPDGAPDGAGSPDGARAGAGSPDGHGGAERPLVDPALLRRAAAAAFTLLSNEGGVLPLDADSLGGPAGGLALIGPNAVHPVTQGGGSAAVNQVSVSTPAEALRTALAGPGLAGQAPVRVEPGCVTWEAVPEPPPSSLTDPVTGQPGVRLEFRAADGRLLTAEHRTAAMFTWWEGLPDGIGWGGRGRITLRARFRADGDGDGDGDGPYLIGAGGVGQLSLSVDGTVLAEGTTPDPADPVEAMVRPGEIRATVPLRAGQEAEIEVTLLPSGGAPGPVSIRLGAVPAPDEDAMLEAAVQAAREASAAIVIVGSPPTAESEGFDRPTLALAGRQDELVRRVAAVNHRTIVVVNAGMPVLMPWAGEVAAVGYAWLGGQAMGDALADVLFGRVEPGGRLPVTLPGAEADCPVLHAIPDDDGQLRYDEGLLIGYRGFDRAGTSPHFPFGHGLGYTTWALESARALHGTDGADVVDGSDGAGNGSASQLSASQLGAVQASPVQASAAQLSAGLDLEIVVVARNTGARTGGEVVQAYVTGPGSLPPGDERRPVRTLAAFGRVTAGPGEAAEVRLRIPARAFARYDEHAGAGQNTDA
ncbi:MAG: glycoside hydrolase family 3 C-terminal domain-containing protein, partial [Streptosporangiaceae bacterium]